MVGKVDTENVREEEEHAVAERAEEGLHRHPKQQAMRRRSRLKWAL